MKAFTPAHSFRNYNKPTVVEFDAAKRDAALSERGVDFADAPQVFEAEIATAADERTDYGEQRFITLGMLRFRAVVVVWTPRGAARRIISMRYANERETAKAGLR